MVGYRNAVSLLPSALQTTLLRVPESVASRVQEIRLRTGQPIALGVGGTLRFLTESGALCEEAQEALVCEARWLIQTVERITQYSAYAYRDTLRDGYVTTNGCRVGLAGTAITENGQVTGYRDWNAVCIRVARRHDGCATSLLPYVYDRNGTHSALLCGEPSCGKTSLLRDLALQLATYRLAVSVIDERGEIAENGTLRGCDVLCGTPKTVGVEQAVRCLAPRVVLLDELGDATEWRAVNDAARRGVPTIATMHARSPRELLARDGAQVLLKGGLFEYLIVLEGRERPGAIQTILKTEVWLRETVRSTFSDADGCGDRITRPSCSGRTGGGASLL